MRLLAWMLFSASVLAQAPKPPVYSVASVRQNVNEADRSTYKLTASGLSTHRNSLIWLIQTAYAMPEERMVKGAPAWVKNERYDIEAKIDDADASAVAALTPEQRAAMLRPVLEERFHLKYHYETELLPRFALVAAKVGMRTDKLVPSSPDAKMAVKYSGHYVLTASMTMPELCYMVLSTEAQALTLDRTGLTGRYDFTLSWSREDPAARPADAAEPPAPGIFTAIQEQLGLKLEPVKIPTQVLVIDSVERPSSN